MRYIMWWSLLAATALFESRGAQNFEKVVLTPKITNQRCGAQFCARNHENDDDFAPTTPATTWQRRGCSAAARPSWACPSIFACQHQINGGCGAALALRPFLPPLAAAAASVQQQPPTPAPRTRGERRGQAPAPANAAVCPRWAAGAASSEAPEATRSIEAPKSLRAYTEPCQPAKPSAPADATEESEARTGPGRLHLFERLRNRTGRKSTHLVGRR